MLKNTHKHQNLPFEKFGARVELKLKKMKLKNTNELSLEIQ